MSERPWLQHYDKGVPQHIDYPDVPLYFFLEEAAKKYPESPCTIFHGARISYREMDELTNRLAAGLVDLGVKKAIGWGSSCEHTAVCDGVFCYPEGRGGGSSDESLVFRPRDCASGQRLWY